VVGVSGECSGEEFPSLRRRQNNLVPEGMAFSSTTGRLPVTGGLGSTLSTFKIELSARAKRQAQRRQSFPDLTMEGGLEGFSARESDKEVQEQHSALKRRQPRLSLSSMTMCGSTVRIWDRGRLYTVVDGQIVYSHEKYLL